MIGLWIIVLETFCCLFLFSVNNFALGVRIIFAILSFSLFYVLMGVFCIFMFLTVGLSSLHNFFPQKVKQFNDLHMWLVNSLSVNVFIQNNFKLKPKKKFYSTASQHLIILLCRKWMKRFFFHSPSKNV